MADAWCDVAARGDGFVTAEATAGTIKTTDWEKTLPVDALMEIRVAVNASGQIGVIGRAHNGNQAYLVTRTDVKPLGTVFGADPVALRVEGDEFIPYIVRSGTSYTIGADEAVVNREWPLSTQGIREVTPTGIVQRGDDFLSLKNIGGHNFYKRTQKAGFTVGQIDTGIGGAGVLTPDGHFFTAIPSDIAESIHFAVNGDVITVCALTRQGAKFKPFTKPYPVDAVPVPEPEPTTPTTPEPQPVSTPNRLDIVQRVASEHQSLIPLNTTPACGTLTEYIALALNAIDENWGLLSKSAGENNFRGHAVDAVIYRATNQVIDLMSGAGDRDPGSTVPLKDQFDIRVKWQEVGKRDSNNWMAPIQPLDVTPIPTPTPTPTPTPQPPVIVTVPCGCDVDGIAADVHTLSGVVEALSAQVTALQAQLSRGFEASNRILGTITLRPKP